MKLPSTPGALIDLGRKLEQERLEYQREVDEKIKKMKAAEEQVEVALIAYCETNKVEKISGRTATATFHKNPLPTAKDWNAIYEYIRKTGEFDLLEKRLGKSAYKERLAAGQRVPGVETFWQKSISFSKSGGSK